MYCVPSPSVPKAREDNADFQRKYDAKRDELAKMQKELQDLQQQLTTQGTTMSEEARAALARTIDQKTTAFQRSQEDAEKEFTNLRNEIFSRIGAKMTPIVQQYAKEKSFTLLSGLFQPNRSTLLRRSGP